MRCAWATPILQKGSSHLAVRKTDLIHSDIFPALRVAQTLYTLPLPAPVLYLLVLCLEQISQPQQQGDADSGLQAAMETIVIMPEMLSYSLLQTKPLKTSIKVSCGPNPCLKGTAPAHQQQLNLQGETQCGTAACGRQGENSVLATISATSPAWAGTAGGQMRRLVSTSGSAFSVLAPAPLQTPVLGFLATSPCSLSHRLQDSFPKGLTSHCVPKEEDACGKAMCLLYHHLGKDLAQRSCCLDARKSWFAAEGMQTNTEGW